jgi:glycosyltransferase involved in cell wall biosynthesis
MRIVLVLGSSTGGIGSHVRDLAEFLVRQGHQVVVAAPAETGEQFGFVGADSGRSTGPATSAATTTATTATTATTPAPTSGISRSIRFVPVAIHASPDPVRDLSAVRSLRRLIHDADVVHAHGVRAGSLTRLALLSLRRPPRSVVTLHNAMLATGTRARVLGVLERLAVRHADVVLGASSDLVAHARDLGARRAELGPVPAPPLRPPTRSRTRVRAELGIDPSRPLLLAVGRLAPQKAYPVLLDALARLDVQSKPALVIAGDGPLHESLEDRIGQLGLDARLLGRRDDIADLLAAADVFVLCSVWEARALVVQEAMRAGLPVLATRVGGIPELVGEAAALVPPDDPGAFARALARILDDPDEQQRLRRASAAQAASWPTAEAALALVLAGYSADRAG